MGNAIPCYPPDAYPEWEGWAVFLGSGKSSTWELSRQFWSYEQVKEYIAPLKLKGQTDWNKWRISGARPISIPSNPQRHYTNAGCWISWGDFLGTGNVFTHDMDWPSFEEARSQARKLGLKSSHDWRRGVRPPNLPANPQSAYPDKWQGWGDFLGNGNICTHDREHRTLEEIREYLRQNNIGSKKEWMEFCAAGKRPDDIPATIENVFSDEGWSWTEWAQEWKRFKHLSYEDAKKIVLEHGIKNKRAYSLKSDILVELGLPRWPEGFYNEWKGWTDFLSNDYVRKCKGCGSEFRTSDYRKIYCRVGCSGQYYRKAKDPEYKAKKAEKLAFAAARKISRSLDFSSVKEWRTWTSSHLYDERIPKYPEDFYDEWAGWSDWLGNVVKSVRNREYLPFGEAREIARSLGFSTVNEWKDWTHSNEYNLHVPARPYRIYGEWVGWSDWLGNPVVSNHDRKFRPFIEARSFVRTLHLSSFTDWKEYCSSRSRPLDIPSNPHSTYGEEWRGYADWVGVPDRDDFWTEEELALVSDGSIPAKVVAEKINRSESAIYHKRSRLKVSTKWRQASCS